MSEANDEGISSWRGRESLARELVPLLELYDVKWRGHGWIYVDHQQDNVATAHRIVTDLSLSLGVPALQIRARLVELGWLRDVRYTVPPREERAPLPDELTAWDDKSEEDYPESNEDDDPY